MASTKFETELADLLNTHSVDTELGMHDYVIAGLMVDFINALAKAKRCEVRASSGFENE